MKSFTAQSHDSDEGKSSHSVVRTVYNQSIYALERSFQMMMLCLNRLMRVSIGLLGPYLFSFVESTASLCRRDCHSLSKEDGLRVLNDALFMSRIEAFISSGSVSNQNKKSIVSTIITHIVGEGRVYAPFAASGRIKLSALKEFVISEVAVVMGTEVFNKVNLSFSEGVVQSVLRYYPDHFRSGERQYHDLDKLVSFYLGLNSVCFHDLVVYLKNPESLLDLVLYLMSVSKASVSQFQAYQCLKLGTKICFPCTDKQLRFIVKMNMDAIKCESDYPLFASRFYELIQSSFEQQTAPTITCGPLNAPYWSPAERQVKLLNALTYHGFPSYDDILKVASVTCVSLVLNVRILMTYPELCPAEGYPMKIIDQHCDKAFQSDIRFNYSVYNPVVSEVFLLYHWKMFLPIPNNPADFSKVFSFIIQDLSIFQKRFVEPITSSGVVLLSPRSIVGFLRSVEIMVANLPYYEQAKGQYKQHAGAIRNSFKQSRFTCADKNYNPEEIELKSRSPRCVPLRYLMRDFLRSTMRACHLYSLLMKREQGFSLSAARNRQLGRYDKFLSDNYGDKKVLCDELGAKMPKRKRHSDDTNQYNYKKSHLAN